VAPGKLHIHFHVLGMVVPILECYRSISIRDG